MLNYLKFIKCYPFAIILGTIINLMCLFGLGYNKAFDNDIFNFLLCEIGILLLYLLYFKIKIR